jgi:hypothetical protein
VAWSATGAGAELQRVLAANKAALRERKGAAKELGAKVNECKRWIDKLRGEVEALNERRGGGNAGENEPLVLEQDDFRKVVEMKVGWLCFLFKSINEMSGETCGKVPRVCAALQLRNKRSRSG